MGRNTGRFWGVLVATDLASLLAGGGFVASDLSVVFSGDVSITRNIGVGGLLGHVVVKDIPRGILLRVVLIFRLSKIWIDEFGGQVIIGLTTHPLKLITRFSETMDLTKELIRLGFVMCNNGLSEGVRVLKSLLSGFKEVLNAVALGEDAVI